MKNKILATSIFVIILAASILPMIHIAKAVDVTLTLSDAELSLFTSGGPGWGPGILTGVNDVPGPGVRFDFINLGKQAAKDGFPVSALAGGAPDSIGGWGDFRAYTRYRLTFCNIGPTPVWVNIFMNTGWTNPVWQRDTYWENGWVYVGVGETRIVTLDFSSATCWNAQDDPNPAWQYPGGTSGVIVRRLSEVSKIGFQAADFSGGPPSATSLIVSATTPADADVILPDAELATCFTQETGPATVSIFDITGPGVRFDFSGLSTSTGTVVGDAFPVNALAGGAYKDYGSGFSGPYDFTGYARYSLVFKNVGTTSVTVNVKMNTGWTNPPWGSPSRDSFWQGTWTTIPAGESRVVTLDFWSAEVWHASDDPNPAWQYPDGTTGVIVRRLDEVSDIGFQVMGSGAASLVVIGETVLTLPDAEMNTQFAVETGPGSLNTITDVPGPGVKFDFTGLNTATGTVVGDTFPVSPLAGGAYKTYGILNPFSTWGDFFDYTKYSMIVTNVGTNPVTVNLKINTGWTIPPPEYAAPWRDTFWQSAWTTIAPGESKILTLDFSSAQVWNAMDEQEYPTHLDGTAGVTVWRLKEVSDIGFQILGNGAASILIAARPQPPEVYVDDDYTSSTLGWGYDHFARVQDGIDAVAFGGITHVYDGTYNEALYISKPVTVKAGSSPVIQGSQLFATDYGNREAVIFVKNAANVILEGLDIEGLGLGPGKNYGVLYQNSNGTIKGCTISPNTIGDLSSTGISAISKSNLRVENCIVENFGRVGIYATNAKVEIHNNKIIGQPYTGSGDVNYGIEIEDYDGASTAIITNNEIYDCGDSNPSPLWSSAAIIVDIWRYYGYNFAPSTVSIEHNDIHNNFEAIEVVSNSLSHAHYNNIHGNLYGVWTDSDENGNYETFDARFNWWGDASGPYQATTNPSGLGNDAGDYVDYSPWLGFVVGTSPMTYHVNPSGGSDAIQEAIDEAIDGDTIYAHAGTYYENQVIIDKSLIVQGSGADTTTLDGGGVLLPEAGLVRITATTGDVTFKGFTLKNAGGPDIVKDWGTFRLRVCIYASSSVSGLTYTISDNKIYGTNNDVEEEDYGVYAYGGKENLIFSHNMITQTGANAMLVELHSGPVDIGFNTLDVGCYGCDGIFIMTYGGTDVTTLQKIHDNTIDVGTGGPFDYDHRATGITFASSYGGGSLGDGKFTNVLISKNTIVNIKNYRRGIGLWNGGGAGGSFVAPVITGNTVIGTDGKTGTFGIRLLGLVSNALVTSNDISGCAIGILINDTATATIRYNEVKNNDCGILVDSDNCIIERNKILNNNGPFSGIHLTSTADNNEIHYNCIVGNTGVNVYGIYKEGGSTVNATFNWWGDSTGPYHPTKNPLGLGNKVSDYVLFEPWLKAYFDYSPKKPEVNDPVTFDASLSTTPCSTKTIVSYTWNFDDGNVTVTSNPIIVHAFVTSGDYNVTLKLTYDDTTTNTMWTLLHVSKVPYLKVVPEVNNVKILNSFFQVSVTINDLDAKLETIAVQFRLRFNSTLMEFINVTEGSFMRSCAPHGTFFSYVLFDVDPSWGPNVIVAVLINPNDTGYWSPPYPSGSGTIATIWFEAKIQERGLEKTPLSCGLNLVETIVLDSEGAETPHTLQNGIYKMYPTHVCDLNYDGKVDVKDFYRVSKAFGTDPSRPKWDPIADVNFDGKIDVKDVYLTAKAYGWVQDPDP